MKKSLLPFFALSLFVFGLDQATKHLVKANFHMSDVVRILPFFNIVYVENVGSAFGMFRSLGNAFFIGLASVAVAAITALMVKDRENRLALALVLGGAAGNLADRIRYGYVVDFLDVYAGRFHWPAFNIADSALTVGICLMLVNTLAAARRLKR